MKDIIKRVLIYSILIFGLIVINGPEHINGKQSSQVNWQKLKQQSQQTLSENPDDILANFKLSIAMANLGQIEETYALMDELSDNFSKKEFNRVVGPYLRALTNHPDNVLLLNYAAFSASINKDYPSAIIFFRRILEIEPENIWIMNYLAAAQIELEQYDQAEEVLNKALELKDNKYSHLLLSILNYEQGNILKALLEMGRSGDLVKKFIFNDDK